MKIKLSLLVLMLSSASAYAADTVAHNDPAPMAASFDWSGAYIGANVGYTHGNIKTRDTTGLLTKPSYGYHSDNGVAAIDLGYNWQFNNVVLGLEGDIGYMGSGGHRVIGSAAAASHQDLRLEGGLYGDVTGRLGYSFGRVLIYGKGGFAFFTGEATQKTTNPGYVTHGTDTFTGWTAGAGVEYALSQKVSLDLQYAHYDFGSQGGDQTNVGDVTSPIGYKFRNDTSVKMDTVTVGLKYRF